MDDECVLQPSFKQASFTKRNVLYIQHTDSILHGSTQRELDKDTQWIKDPKTDITVHKAMYKTSIEQISANIWWLNVLHKETLTTWQVFKATIMDIFSVHVKVVLRTLQI